MKATVAFAFFLLFLAGIALTNIGQLQTRQAGELRAPLAAELVTNRWRLAAMRGPAAPDSAAIELVFTRGGLLSVTGTCNRYTADYELSDGSLDIREVNGTKLACPADRMGYDDALVSILGRTAMGAIDDGQLVLLSADGERLARFAAETPGSNEP